MPVTSASTLHSIGSMARIRPIVLVLEHVANSRPVLNTAGAVASSRCCRRASSCMCCLPARALSAAARGAQSPVSSFSSRRCRLAVACVTRAASRPRRRAPAPLHTHTNTLELTSVAVPCRYGYEYS